MSGDVAIAIEYLRKAQFRLEVIEEILDDMNELRLIGEVRAAHRILCGVKGNLAERDGEEGGDR